VMLLTSTSTNSISLTTFTNYSISIPYFTPLLPSTLWHRRISHAHRFPQTLLSHQTHRMACRDLQRVFARCVRFGNELCTTYDHHLQT
jgi:hypothetical protein